MKIKYVKERICNKRQSSEKAAMVTYVFICAFKHAFASSAFAAMAAAFAVGRESRDTARPVNCMMQSGNLCVIILQSIHLH